MIEKVKLHKKILLTSILVILIVISAGVYILAIDTKELVPEIDLYRNGSVETPHDYPVTNGSGVEYNGFRIGSTVWCKKRDILGVTAWGKQKVVNDDMNNSIKTSYLSLGGTNSPTNFAKDQPLDGYSHEGEVNVISGSSDVEVVNARRGRTGDSSKYLHYGALFWIQFNEDNRAYTIRSNQESFNGNWIENTNGNDLSTWRGSNEIIRTDGNGPKIDVKPNTNTTSTNTDINVNMHILDKESGIQYYTYTVTKNGQQLKSDTKDPEYHSNISADSYFVPEDDQSLYNNKYKGGYVTDYDPEKTAIPYSTNEMEQNINLSDVGDYTVEITAVDNVGNSNEATFYYTINPPPPKLNAEIVNENYESFNGIPTLKRGKLYNLKIYTEQYAENLYIIFPFTVLPDLQSLQKYGNNESYDSLSTKTIDITPKVSDTNYLPFIIPVNKEDAFEVEDGEYSIMVDADYKNGQYLTTQVPFKVKDSITDHIKVSTLP